MAAVIDEEGHPFPRYEPVGAAAEENACCAPGASCC